MNCEECGAAFSISAKEAAQIGKVFSPTLPAPAVKKCPACRMRHRLCFRNERKLYRGTCAVSGKSIISLYRPGAPFTVYDQTVWWSDAYDPLEYGVEVDFKQPIFPQIEQLHQRVPKLSIHNAKSENCDYTNYSLENRNCYLVVGTFDAEDCLYSYRISHSKNVVDCFGLSKCELCYECMQGTGLFGCSFATNCHNSSNLYLCEDCIGCRDCIGCVNLRNSQYCIFNQPVSAETYNQRAAALQKDLISTRRLFDQIRAAIPARSTYSVSCENSSGDQIRNCRRCSNVYYLIDSEDVIHSRNGEGNRDCVDINFCDKNELQYQATNLQQNYRVAFAALAWYVSDSFYLLSCFNSKNLFGCCGMKKNEYCILNRQYSPGDYEKMVKRIAAHMVETGEWGSFFPPSISPFLFNETIAAEFFPLTDAQCIARGYNSGRGPEQEESPRGADLLPQCTDCGRRFRIISQESKFYQQARLHPPLTCPDCRHRARLARRRPMELRSSSCIQCSSQISTSAPDGDVLCERCFGVVAE